MASPDTCGTVSSDVVTTEMNHEDTKKHEEHEEDNDLNAEFGEHAEIDATGPLRGRDTKTAPQHKP